MSCVSRFSLEEMIALRHNSWVARRAEEGPAKIEDIHKKIAQEEYLKQQQQQQQQAPPSYGSSGGIAAQVIFFFAKNYCYHLYSCELN